MKPEKPVKESATSPPAEGVKVSKVTGRTSGVAARVKLDASINARNVVVFRMWFRLKGARVCMVGNSRRTSAVQHFFTFSNLRA